MEARVLVVVKKEMETCRKERWKLRFEKEKNPEMKKVLHFGAGSKHSHLL